VLRTDRSEVRVGNIGHACYFDVGAWLSNFCHGLATFWVPSVQKWILYENVKVLRIGEEGERKNGGWGKI